MSKIEIAPLPSGNATTTALNDRLQLIEDALNNEVLYRDNPVGEPNSMNNTLDMDSNAIINVPDATLDHQAVNKGQVDQLIEDSPNWDTLNALIAALDVRLDDEEDVTASLGTAAFLDKASEAETLAGVLDNVLVTPSGLEARITDLQIEVGLGDVVGPNTSTNNNLALFDGATGNLLKNGPQLDHITWSVDLFADLADIAPATNQAAYILGVDSIGDGKDGVYIARTGTYATDVEGGCIESDTAGTYWVRQDYTKLRTPARDVQALVASAFNSSSLRNGFALQKLRTDYPEFAVYTPLTSDDKVWERRLFTNRFNLGNSGAPRMILNSLANLYSSATIAHVADNKASGTTATAATVTALNTDGVQVGTWTSPTTFGGVANINYSTTVGDTKTWTVTGAERYTMESVFLSNGGIANVKVYTDAGLTTEIPEGNYCTPTDRLVHFSGGSNNLQHIPLCKGLTSGSTYYIRTTVDATNPASGRVYQGRIFGYPTIAYNAVGIHGVVDDAALGGQTNSRSYNPGTTAVYFCEDCTKIDWRYVETFVGSIVTFLIYDSGGTPIGSGYVNPFKDTYAVGSTAKKITVAEGLPLGDYYLHVQNGKTRNPSNTGTPGYRYYDFGVITYNEESAGVFGTDEFDNRDVPLSITDPNNDSGNGTSYGLMGTVNLELAISIRDVGTDPGDEEFVGGIHSFDQTPTPVFTVDGDVIDYAGAAQYAMFYGGELLIEFDTPIYFPDVPVWAAGSYVIGNQVYYAINSHLYTCNTNTTGVPGASGHWTDNGLANEAIVASYKYHLSHSGYAVETELETSEDTYVHNDYAIMMNAPNTATNTQGLLVGGGFKYVAADQNYTINAFDNSSTLIAPKQTSCAFVNSEYMVMVTYTTTPDIPEIFKSNPFDQVGYFSLIQDRTDKLLKFYTLSFSGNPTTGILVPAGTRWKHSKVYRTAKGNFKGLLGILSA